MYTKENIVGTKFYHKDDMNQLYTIDRITGNQIVLTWNNSLLSTPWNIEDAIKLLNRGIDWIPQLNKSYAIF